jgi:hypothetical protein
MFTGANICFHDAFHKKCIFAFIHITAGRGRRARIELSSQQTVGGSATPMRGLRAVDSFSCHRDACSVHAAPGFCCGGVGGAPPESHSARPSLLSSIMGLRDSGFCQQVHTLVPSPPPSRDARMKDIHAKARAQHVKGPCRSTGCCWVVPSLWILLRGEWYRGGERGGRGEGVGGLHSLK